MSQGLVERLKSELTPQLQGYLAKSTGETPAAVAKAVETTVSTIVTGIAGTASSPAGLSALSRLISDPVNDGTLLNQLPALYQGTMTAAPIYRLGSQMLHQVFGAKLASVNQSIATLTGIKPSSASVLTSTLSPHVLAALGQLQRANGDLSPAALASMLGPGAVSAVTPGKAAEPDTKAVTIAATPPAKATAAPVAAAPTPTIAEVPPGRPDPGRPTPGRSPANADSGAWLIFPIGLVMGVGLIGVGSLISNQMGVMPERPAPTAAEPLRSESKPPIVAEAPPVKGTPQAAPERVPGPPGTTSYFGVSPKQPDQPVVVNPEYLRAIEDASKAAAAEAAKAEAARKEAAAAEATKAEAARKAASAAEAAKAEAARKEAAAAEEAKAEAARKEAAAEAAKAEAARKAASAAEAAKAEAARKEAAARPSVASAPAVVAGSPPPKPAGTTTYFGVEPRRADAPVFINPDYKPAAKSAGVSPPGASGITACKSAVAVAAGSGVILFETASAALQPQSVAIVERVAEAFKSCATGRLRIEGHTDGRGSADYNFALSKARARSVADYLSQKGIDRKRLSAIGFGLSKPLVPNTTPENLAKNRRIEFVVR